MAPLPGKYGHYSGRGQGDYEEHRVLQMQGNMGDYDDPYGRIMFRGGGPAGRRPSHPGTLGGGGGQGPHKAHHMQHSVSQSRIQSHQGNSKLLNSPLSTNSTFQCQKTSSSTFRPPSPLVLKSDQISFYILLRVDSCAVVLVFICKHVPCAVQARYLDRAIK